jgi:hypothetical protein
MTSILHIEWENGKKIQVKTTPMMSLRTVKDEAVKSFKFTSGDYGLRKGPKNILDLDLTMRFSGLASGSKLQLVPVKKIESGPAVVTICLQLEDGSRQIEK